MGFQIQFNQVCICRTKRIFYIVYDSHQWCWKYVWNAYIHLDYNQVERMLRSCFQCSMRLLNKQFVHFSVYLGSLRMNVCKSFKFWISVSISSISICSAKWNAQIYIWSIALYAIWWLRKSFYSMKIMIIDSTSINSPILNNEIGLIQIVGRCTTFTICVYSKVLAFQARLQSFSDCNLQWL